MDKLEGKFNALKAWQEMLGIKDYDTFEYYGSSSSYGERLKKCYCSNGRMFDYNGHSTDIQTVGFLINGLWDIYNIEKAIVVDYTLKQIKQKLNLPKNAVLHITDSDQ